MQIALPPLPYPYEALEPFISRTTLELHHGKHHKAYVDKTKALAKEVRLADLPRTLPVDFEDHVVAASERLGQGRAARAVVVIKHQRVFEKTIRVDHVPKGRHVDKVVVPPVHFVGASRPCGVRDADSQIGLAGQQLPDETCLARTRWRGDDEQLAAAGSRAGVVRTGARGLRVHSRG